MGFKLPEFKKFCFCIPIRYGFIIWGYLSLILSFSLLCWQIKDIHDILHKEKQEHGILEESIDFIMLLIGAAFIVLFVVAVHKNNVKLLKLAFKCNLISVIIYTLYFIYMFLYASAMLKFLYTLSGWSGINKPFIWTLVLVALGAIIDILIKYYVMLLLRNEIKKLETNGCQIRYVITAAKANCILKSEDKIKKIEDEEKGVEDTIERTYKKEQCNSPNNMTETKCTIEWNMKE